LLRKLSKIEDSENKKKREFLRENINYKWGRWYMPWASYYWKLGKKCRHPDIGIITLEDSDGKICTHDQKDEIIVAYMKKYGQKGMKT